MNAWSGFLVSIILYEVKRSRIYGIVLIPDNCLPDAYTLHMGVGDGIAEIPVESTQFPNVSFPLLSMFVYSTLGKLEVQVCGEMDKGRLNGVVLSLSTT